MIKNSKGQVALIVLIVSAIALTLGLSLSDRVTTDVSTNADEELLQKAFNAAESGIENEIVNPGSVYVAPDGFSSAEVTTTEVTGQTIDFGQFVASNDYAHFWLAGHDVNDNVDLSDVYGGSTIDICFDDYDGAVVVYYFGINGGNYGVIRKVYNLTGASNVIENGLTVGAGMGGCGSDYGQAIEDFDVTGFSTPLLLVVKPLYEGSRFGLVSDGNSFPSQGTIIDSTGIVADVSTNLKVYQRWDPSVYLSFLIEGMTAEDSINSE